jgi:hypothetical protein
MTLRLVLIVAGSAIPLALLASDNASKLSPFPDAGKSRQQLAREAVDRQIATYVQGRQGKDSAAPLMLQNLPAAKLLQRARSESCSIPLLESKIEHPERFRMKTLKLRAAPADNMAVRPPAPTCLGWN